MEAAIAMKPATTLLMEQNYERPAPGPGQVLIRVLCCGLCHTDVHVVSGEFLEQPRFPLIPGHEIVGIIEELGFSDDSETDVKLGDRVGVPWLHWTCGQCEWCWTGRENLCPRQLNTGFNVNGGMAQFVLAYSRFVVPIPESMPSVVAAPLLCAGLTTFNALKATGAQAGQWVGIVGVGGLGHLGIPLSVMLCLHRAHYDARSAKAMGLNVVGVDIDHDKLQLALEMGADATVNAKDEKAVTLIQEGTPDHLGLHAVVVTAVSPASIGQAMQTLRRGGVCVLVGLRKFWVEFLLDSMFIAPGDFPMNVCDTVVKGLTVRGSYVGTRQDLVECLNLAAKFKIQPHVEPTGLFGVNEAIERMKNGEIRGRVVVCISEEADEFGH